MKRITRIYHALLFEIESVVVGRLASAYRRQTNMVTAYGKEAVTSIAYETLDVLIAIGEFILSTIQSLYKN